VRVAVLGIGELVGEERIIPTVLGFSQWFLRPGMHRCNAKNLQCAWALMPSVWASTNEPPGQHQT
jgi:hypothetical protein